MSSVATGRTHAAAPFVPEVGSQLSVTAKISTPMMANQKSGTLAAVEDRKLATRSVAELGRYAARLPMTTAPTMASSIVHPASWSVAGKARSTASLADWAVRSDSPKSRCATWTR
jgi:hypothetical protein